MTYKPTETTAVPKLSVTQKEAMRTIATARMRCSLLANYFTFPLSRLRFAPEPGLGTFGISKKGLVYFDPALICGDNPRWNVDQTAAVLAHELMHRLSKHAERAEGIGVQPDEWVLWNMAADAEINYKLRDQFNLPDGPYYPETIWPKLDDTPVGHSIDYSPWYGYSIYKDGRNIADYSILLAETMFFKLREQSKTKPQQPQGLPQDKGGSGEGDEEGDDSQVSAASEPGSDPKPEDGSPDPGAGTGDPGDPGEGEGAGEGGSQGEGEPTPYPWGKCGSGAGEGCVQVDEDALERKWLADGDSGWQSHEVDAMAEQVAREIIEESGNTHGGRSSAMARWALELDARAKKVPWYRILQTVCQNLIQESGGSVDYSYKRQSRRQATVGYGPGKPVYPSIRGVKPTIGVSIDISGSVSDAELDQMLAQVQSISRQLGVEILLSAFDDTFKGGKKVRDVRKAKHLFSNGGGGTMVAPVFEFYGQSKNRVDILVILTDGCLADAPSTKPNYPIVWGLVGKYRRKPSTTTYQTVRYGKFVEIDLDD